MQAPFSIPTQVHHSDPYSFSTGPAPPFSTPSTSGVDAESDDDWLADDDGGGETGAAEREWQKLSNRYSDEGYREGITAGKLSTLQAGFDEGFTNVGVPLGRRLGRLRGKAQALLSYLSTAVSASSTSRARCSPSTHGVNRPTPRTGGARNIFGHAGEATALADESDLLESLRALISDLSRVRLDDIAAPDQEAIEHEREHLDAAARGTVRGTPSTNRPNVEEDMVGVGTAGWDERESRKEMDMLEDLMEGMGRPRGDGAITVDGEAKLTALEARLRELMAQAGLGVPSTNSQSAYSVGER